MKKIIMIIAAICLCFSFVQIAYASDEQVAMTQDTLVTSTVSILGFELIEEHKDQLIRSAISEEEEIRMAKALYGEDRENSLMQRAAVIWCMFNRLDDGGFGDSLKHIVRTSQFHGYRDGHQKHPEWTHKLVRDVALRYVLEKMGYENVGRILPKEYTFFAGRGGHNHFRTAGGRYWHWDLETPYYIVSEETVEVSHLAQYYDTYYYDYYDWTENADYLTFIQNCDIINYNVNEEWLNVPSD